MASLLDIRRRIRAVKSTQQITKAMKAISASRLRRAQESMMGARPFASQMERVLGGTDKIILDSSKGSQGVVPYLPLDQLQRKPQGGK